MLIIIIIFNTYSAHFLFLFKRVDFGQLLKQTNQKQYLRKKKLANVSLSKFFTQINSYFQEHIFLIACSLRFCRRWIIVALVGAVRMSNSPTTLTSSLIVILHSYFKDDTSLVS